MKLKRSPSAMVIVDGTDIHHDLIGAALALQEIVTEAGLPTARWVATNTSHQATERLGIVEPVVKLDPCQAREKRG